MRALTLEQTYQTSADRPSNVIGRFDGLTSALCKVARLRTDKLLLETVSVFANWLHLRKSLR